MYSVGWLQACIAESYLEITALYHLVYVAMGAEPRALGILVTDSHLKV